MYLCLIKSGIFGKYLQKASLDLETCSVCDVQHKMTAVMHRNKQIPGVGQIIYKRSLAECFDEDSKRF